MTKLVYKSSRSATIQKLKNRIKKAWSELSQSTLQRIVHQIPLRLAEISKLKGKQVIDFKQKCLCNSCVILRTECEL